MGYFDALTSSSFKTAPDGRRLFFPWGTLGRGYVIGSEPDFKRLERQVRTYLIAMLTLIIGLSVLGSTLVTFAAGALLTCCYAACAWHLTRRLQSSDERLSLRESLATQARAHSGLSLWLLEIASLVLLGSGGLMLFIDPDNRLTAFGCIVFFGICTAAFTILLVQRRRQSAV
jgi:hypothetical protein